MAPVTDKAGTFVTWEGRERPFRRIFDRPASYSDARVLELIAEAYRRIDLAGLAGAAADITEAAEEEVEPQGATAAAEVTAAPAPRPYRLATWRLLLDNGTLRGTIPTSQYSNASENVVIGRRTGGYYFAGTIDELRLYNRALSQAEIQADMATPIAH